MKVKFPWYRQEPTRNVRVELQGFVVGEPAVIEEKFFFLVRSGDSFYQVPCESCKIIDPEEFE